jgi:hypothetical protein
MLPCTHNETVLRVTISYIYVYERTYIYILVHKRSVLPTESFDRIDTEEEEVDRTEDLDID